MVPQSRRVDVLEISEWRELPMQTLVREDTRLW